jgi:hypothetical protein
MATTMDDQAKQAFTAASDWAKQILTLSTAIVTLTATLADKFFGEVTTWEKVLLVLAWTGYLISICGGIWVLTRLAGALASETDVKRDDVVRRAQGPADVQVWPFIAATIVIAIFGFFALGNKPKKQKPANQSLPAPTLRAPARL